jgi:hypothetical protein
MVISPSKKKKKFRTASRKKKGIVEKKKNTRLLHLHKFPNKVIQQHNVKKRGIHSTQQQEKKRISKRKGKKKTHNHYIPTHHPFALQRHPKNSKANASSSHSTVQ